ncbi:MAG TPA: SirB2 family protein [Steroidobacteraceae bacterium]|nr:SirB2 family protein [Steroidobacteraceae bacterium]
MLAAHYADIRLLHVSCAALSGALFALRGIMRIADSPWANHRALRLTSYLIDTTLLLAALWLSVIVQQYPFVDGWLTTKVVLLVIYIGLGVLALRVARTRAGRVAALISALLTFGAIVGVAVTHHPAGWLFLIHRGCR